jgi:hypothetical protein
MPPNYTFTQKFAGAIPLSWVLLDSESTISVFRNLTLLNNIRRSDAQVTVYTNAGKQISKMVGDIPNFGTVWFNLQSIANIMSLAAVRKVCRITMDTTVKPAFLVHRKDAFIMKFKEFHSGLYYHNTLSLDVTDRYSVEPYSFLNVVAQNKKNFTTRQINQADKARALYCMLGRPSEQTFASMLNNNVIHNCPLTFEDAKRAMLIYGPDRAHLQGTTVKIQGPRVPTTQIIPIPAYIQAHHINVTLAMDVFFVQSHRFHYSISRDIKFRTVCMTDSVSKSSLLECCKSTMQLNSNRGFKVIHIHADGAFAYISNDIGDVVMNINITDDHVGEVERSIRTIKERVRTTLHGLPYK